MESLSGSDSHYAKHFNSLQLVDSLLKGKEFEECDFKGCDLSGATLSHCKFLDCRFAECNLSLAKVASSKFRGVEFDGCKAVGINWTQAIWQSLATSAPLKFRKCIVNDSSFFGLDLADFVLEDCKARDVDFREATLTGALFGRTELSGCLFGKTILNGADFVDATNYDIDVFENQLKNAKFSRFEALRLLDCLEIELVD